MRTPCLNHLKIIYIGVYKRGYKVIDPINSANLEISNAITVPLLFDYNIAIESRWPSG